MLSIYLLFLENRHYDGTVNFLHYLDADTYTKLPGISTL